MRRRGRHDVLDARDFGSSHAHDGAGRMGVAATRDVAARRLAWNETLTGAQAGQKLGAELLHRGALLLRKGAHPLVGEADVVFNPLGKRFFGARKGVWPEHDRAVPAIKRPGVGAYPLFATGADLAQHGLHCLGGRGIGALGRKDRSLEVVSRHGVGEISVLAPIICIAFPLI